MSYIRQSRVQPDRLDTCASVAWTQVRNKIINFNSTKNSYEDPGCFTSVLILMMPNDVNTIKKFRSELDLVDGRVLILVLW